MPATVIDTLRYANSLKDAGVDASQAEAMARAINAELTLGLATKADLDHAAAQQKGDLDRAVAQQKGDLDRAVAQQKGTWTGQWRNRRATWTRRWRNRRAT